MLTAVKPAEPLADPPQRESAAVVGIPTGYVAEIDSLRCLAMTLVVLQHCAIIPFGWMGVWLFFVVSGFAITSSLINSPTADGPRGRGIYAFIMRRAIRIWPVYYLFIAANVAFMLVMGLAVPWDDMPYLLTFTYNLRMIFEPAAQAASNWAPFQPLWTIALEEHFYILYPLLFFFLPRSRLETALWVLVASGPIIRLLVNAAAAPWLATPGEAHWIVYTFSIAHFDAFAMGALLAIHRPRFAADPRLAWRLFWAGGLALLAYVGAYAAVQAGETGFGPDAFRDILSGAVVGAGREMFAYSAVALAATGVVALVLARADWLTRLLAPGFLQWAGRISYGAYLFHLPIVLAAGALLPHWNEGYDLGRQVLVFAVSYPLTLLLAHLSFVHFERKFMALRRHFA